MAPKYKEIMAAAGEDPTEDPTRFITESDYYVRGATVDNAFTFVRERGHPIIRPSSQPGKFAVSYYVKDGRFNNVRILVNVDERRKPYMKIDHHAFPQKFYSVDKLLADLPGGVASPETVFAIAAAAPAAATPAPAPAVPAAIMGGAGAATDITKLPLPDPITFRTAPQYSEYYRPEMARAGPGQVFDMFLDILRATQPDGKRHPILSPVPVDSENIYVYLISYFSADARHVIQSIVSYLPTAGGQYVFFYNGQIFETIERLMTAFKSLNTVMYIFMMSGGKHRKRRNTRRTKSRRRHM